MNQDRPGADAGGEGAQGAVGTGVGVRADDDFTGQRQPLFRQQGVFHAHAAHVKEVGDVVLMRKIPCSLAKLGGFDVLAGGVVIQYDGDFVLIKNLGQASLLKLADGHRSGDVVAEHQIQLCLNELAYFHGGQSGVFRQNLLGHRHSHLKFLLIPQIV